MPRPPDQTLEAWRRELTHLMRIYKRYDEGPKTKETRSFAAQLWKTIELLRDLTRDSEEEKVQGDGAVVELRPKKKRRSA